VLTLVTVEIRGHFLVPSWTSTGLHTGQSAQDWSHTAGLQQLLQVMGQIKQKAGALAISGCKGEPWVPDWTRSLVTLK
jgi:hypothetical protein